MTRRKPWLFEAFMLFVMAVVVPATIVGFCAWANVMG